MEDENKKIENAIKKLQSQDKNDRYEACTWLRIAPMITPDAINALQDARHDSDKDVADAAKRALLFHDSHMPLYKSLGTQRSPIINQDVSKGEQYWSQKGFEQMTVGQNHMIALLNSIKTALWIIVVIIVLTGILMFINAVAIQAQGYGIF